MTVGEMREVMNQFGRRCRAAVADDADDDDDVDVARSIGEKLMSIARGFARKIAPPR